MQGCHGEKQRSTAGSPSQTRTRRGRRTGAGAAARPKRLCHLVGPPVGNRTGGLEQTANRPGKTQRSNSNRSSADRVRGLAALPTTTTTRGSRHRPPSRLPRPPVTFLRLRPRAPRRHRPNINRLPSTPKSTPRLLPAPPTWSGPNRSPEGTRTWRLTYEKRKPGVSCLVSESTRMPV